MVIESLDDKHIWTKEIKTLTKAELNIPSVHMIGYASFGKAVFPIDEHYHKDKIEFVVMLKGTQQYVIENTEYLLYGGNVFTTFPNEVHGNNNEPQLMSEFIWFQIDLSAENNFLGLNPPWSNVLYEQIKKYNKRVSKIEIKECMSLMEAFVYLSSDSVLKKLIGYSQFLSFLTQLLSGEGQRQAISFNIQKTLKFIQEHIWENIGFAELSEASGLSVSRLKTKFKEEIGITPREYINSLKVDMAKNMLKNTTQNITDIAFTLNFSSSHYFAYVFKQFTGVTPSEYKEKDLQ